MVSSTIKPPLLHTPPVRAHRIAMVGGEDDERGVRPADAIDGFDHSEERGFDEARHAPARAPPSGAIPRRRGPAWRARNHGIGGDGPVCPSGRTENWETHRRRSARTGRAMAQPGGRAGAVPRDRPSRRRGSVPSDSSQRPARRDTKKASCTSAGPIRRATPDSWSNQSPVSINSIRVPTARPDSPDISILAADGGKSASSR